MVITSASNSKVLLVRKLQDKKYRNRFKQYCIEGVRLYQEALRFGKKPLEVFVKQSLSDKLNIDGATVVEDNIFDKMSDTVSSQGLIAVLPIEDNDTVASGNCLVLDSLQDPGNVGTLLRTACATGFDTVYLYRCVDVYSPKCVRSAMSAHFAINLVTLDDFDVLKQRISNCRVVCADMEGKEPGIPRKVLYNWEELKIFFPESKYDDVLKKIYARCYDFLNSVEGVVEISYDEENSTITVSNNWEAAK